MADPVAVTRETPGGIALQDGYQTLITLTVDPDISFWEKSVTPPGIDGGDPVETTTMHNATWRTFHPRSLKTLTPFSVRVAYDPDAYDEILAVCNVATTITVRFADGSTLAFFGFVQKFEPGDIVEGTQPEATITIVPTNWDHTNKVEAGPVMEEMAGT